MQLRDSFADLFYSGGKPSAKKGKYLGKALEDLVCPYDTTANECIEFFSQWYSLSEETPLTEAILQNHFNKLLKALEGLSLEGGGGGGKLSPRPTLPVPCTRFRKAKNSKKYFVLMPSKMYPKIDFFDFFIVFISSLQIHILVPLQRFFTHFTCFRLPSLSSTPKFRRQKSFIFRNFIGFVHPYFVHKNEVLVFAAIASVFPLGKCMYSVFPPVFLLAPCTDISLPVWTLCSYPVPFGAILCHFVPSCAIQSDFFWHNDHLWRSPSCGSWYPFTRRGGVVPSTIPLLLMSSPVLRKRSS